MSKYDHLSKYFDTLPIEEFKKGNFSEAYQIKELYITLNKKLMETATEQRDKDKEKLEHRKPELLERQQELKESYTTIHENIQNLLKEKNGIIKKIKAMYPDNKSWQTFCDSFDKNVDGLSVNPVTLQLQNDYSDKQKEILQSIYDEVETIRDLQSTIAHKSRTRGEYKYELDGKKNFFNVSNKINESVDSLTVYYRDCILQYFNISGFGAKEEFDNQPLEEYFHELLGAYIIGQVECNDEVRKKNLEKHTDKYGLFGHIFHKIQIPLGELYIFNDYKDRTNVLLMLHNAKEQCVARIIENTHRLLHNAIRISQEEKNEIENKSTYLVEKFSNNQKDTDRWESLQKDKQLDEILKLFESYDIDETLRTSVQNIRNAESMKLEYNLQKIIDMLGYLYGQMTDGDRNYTYYDHSGLIMKNIHTKWSTEQKKISQQQLSLFPMTVEENRTQRIIALEYIQGSLFDYIGYAESFDNLLEKTVFAHSEKIKGKNGKIALKKDRKQNYSKKKIVIEKFLQYIIDKEITQEEFSEEEQDFLSKIMYDKEPLYETYPIA